MMSEGHRAADSFGGDLMVGFATSDLAVTGDLSAAIRARGVAMGKTSSSTSTPRAESGRRGRVRMGKFDRTAGGGAVARRPARRLRPTGGHGPGANAAPPESPTATGEGGNQFHVVVVGAGPVGKTSLVSALLGRSAGATGATFGTTHRGSSHTYSIQGVEGTLLLTDTPGLGDPGPEGTARAAEAIDLACAADLVLYVVDHDLTRTDRDTLIELARLDKRLIAVLNKKDRFTEEDRGAILAKICERLDGFVPPEDILAVAAAPAPVPARVRMPDGTTAIELETEPPALRGARRPRGRDPGERGRCPARGEPAFARAAARAGQAHANRTRASQAGRAC